METGFSICGDCSFNIKPRPPVAVPERDRRSRLYAMKTMQINNQQISVHNYHTLIVGAGAAGMNCAVHLYEFMLHKGVEHPQKKIAVITGGPGLGGARMRG